MKTKTNSVLDKHVEKLRQEISDREKEIAIIQDITEKCKAFNEENKDFKTNQETKDVFEGTLNVIANLQSKIEKNKEEENVLKDSVTNLSRLNNAAIDTAIKSLNSEIKQKEEENNLISDKIIGISKPLSSLMDFSIECPFCEGENNTACVYCHGTKIIKFGQIYNEPPVEEVYVPTQNYIPQPQQPVMQDDYEPIVKSNYFNATQNPQPMPTEQDLQSILFGENNVKSNNTSKKENRVGHTRFVLEQN